MKDKRRRPPSNVIKLFKQARPPLSTAVILEGFELIKVFWKIEDGRDRKAVLEVAKELSVSSRKSTR